MEREKILPQRARKKEIDKEEAPRDCKIQEKANKEKVVMRANDVKDRLK